MTDYAYILSKKYPGKQWVQYGDEYSGIKWLDNSPIVKATLDADYVEYKEQNNYKDQRENEYPSIIDQLDMIYEDKINGTSLWVDAIRAVKEKHPKPKGGI